MRPRRLSIRGLRSYRQHQEIDFTGAGLIAILGDTGAGKSSILEALCVALYAGTTWSKSNVKALISSGLDTLDVELEFTADGRDWRVQRSLPATNYPPAVHKLIGLTDGSRVDGAREVNQRIVELVGLDYDAFLRAVLLPQGRFQALLQATAGDRTSILKGIFRLDLLERVREIARVRCDQLAQRLGDLQAERRGLLDDPEASAAEAGRDHAAAAAEKARLDLVTAALRAANQTSSDLERVAQALAKGAGAVRDHDPAASLGQLTRLIAIAESLDQGRATQVARRGELSAEQGKLAARAQQADSEGLGLDALLGASHTLADLGEWLARRAGERARSEEERRAAAEMAASLDAARLELAAVDQRTAAIEAEVGSARAERDTAQQELDSGRQRLLGARDATLQRDQRGIAAGAREQALIAVGEELEAARRERKAASAALRRAEQALAASQRSHAAAHAAAGVEAGEPCPVCDRKLPASWKAPAAPDLKRAQETLAAARSNERARHEQVTKLEGRVGELEARVAEDRAALDVAEGALRTALTGLRELAGKKADPGSEGEAALESLVRRLAGAAKRFEDTQRRRDGHLKARSERHAVVTRLAAGLEAAARQLESTEQRLGREDADAERRLAGLPRSVRPAGLEAKPLATAHARVVSALEQARENRARHQELSQQILAVQSALSEIDQRREREVLKPTHAVARGLDDLRRVLELLAGEVQGDAPPKSDVDGPDEVAAWARELGECRDRLLRQVTTREKEVAANLAAARNASRDALDAAGVESEAALVRRSTEVAVTLQRKAEDLERARGQIASARELDRRIGGGAPLVDALRELARLLTDGKFIGHVVDRKQQSLLVVASKLFGEMSKDRYGFSQDFEVVDRLTGEPRSVMTLSGGETFLASLALALALVELAGREGGRLDALFLDEGFGSLDADALGEALEALHDQSAKGRLVAVISHLRAVAESIERVLLVTRTPAGSRVEWLGDADRTALVEEEATTGLLA